jgi:flavin-dependent dehydrogenase
MDDYDLVTVGGGLAGSTLGLVMAREGARVLIVEKTKGFRDPGSRRNLSALGQRRSPQVGCL